MAVQSSAKQSGETSGKQAPSGAWLLGLSVMIFLAGTFAAFHQAPHPDPFGPRSAWDGFLYPYEKNAFRRLPAIIGDLNDVFVQPDGETIWVIGAGGVSSRFSPRPNPDRQQRERRRVMAAKAVLRRESSLPRRQAPRPPDSMRSPPGRVGRALVIWSLRLVGSSATCPSV